MSIDFKSKEIFSSWYGDDNGQDERGSNEGGYGDNSHPSVSVSTVGESEDLGGEVGVGRMQ